MQKRTSTIDRRPARRRGFTLAESLIASVALMVSVAGVSGTILASYQNDAVSLANANVNRVAASLMDELTALPMSSSSASEVSLDDFKSYADQASATTPSSAVANVRASKTATAPANTSLIGGLIGGVVAVVDRVVSALLAPATTTPDGVVAMRATPVPTGAVSRYVTVERRAAYDGPSVSGGDVAIVTVSVVLPDKRESKVKRIITAAECAANVPAQ